MPTITSQQTILYDQLTRVEQKIIRKLEAMMRQGEKDRRKQECQHIVNQSMEPNEKSNPRLIQSNESLCHGKQLTNTILSTYNCLPTDCSDGSSLSNYQDRQHKVCALTDGLASNLKSNRTKISRQHSQERDWCDDMFDEMMVDGRKRVKMSANDQLDDMLDQRLIKDNKKGHKQQLSDIYGCLSTNQSQLLQNSQSIEYHLQQHQSESIEDQLPQPYCPSKCYYNEFWKVYLMNMMRVKRMEQLVEEVKGLTSGIVQVESLFDLHQTLKAPLANPLKKSRRLASQIAKSHRCPYPNCNKTYGSDVSLNLHVKLKHGGGKKSEREKVAVRVQGEWWGKVG